MTNPTFFIYLHIRNDTGAVFYVGKGTRTQRKQYQRAYVKERRNSHWQNITAKTAYEVVLHSEFWTEQDAFEMEKALIAEYRRVHDGGSLCNMTLGGEGHCGIIVSDELREKRRINSSGPRSAEWIASVRKARYKGGNGGVVKKGDKLPAWWRERIASAVTGSANHMSGRTGASHPASRKVFDRITGIEYVSISDAAARTGFKMKTLYNWLSGHRVNPTGMEFA